MTLPRKSVVKGDLAACASWRQRGSGW